MTEKDRLQEEVIKLHESVAHLEKELAKSEKIKGVLMARVERSVDSAGDPYSMFENNILLQQRIEQRTKELADANQKLKAEITDRRRAEVALKESEEKYRTQFEEALDAIFVADAETGLLADCNPAASVLLGRAKSELVGKHHQILHPPEELEGGFSRTFQRHLSKEQGQALETQVIAKNGERRDVSIKGNIFELKGKKFIQGIFRDITDHKRAEKEKRKLEAQLQQAQKMEAIGTLAGGVAHDFNNILAALMGYTELVMEDVPQGSMAKANLDEVFRAAGRAKDLVRQILTFSRQKKQEQKPFRVSLIIKEALKLLRASLPSTIEIRQNIGGQSSTILADPTQIHQLLMNLCTNAAHAMQEKGGVGVLEVTLDDVALDADAAARHLDLKPGPYIRLAVSDTGCGMEPRVLERVFDPFFTTKKVGEGTGMGLSVVHGVVKSCGGAIMADSKPGKGTTFQVFLPRSETQTAQAETVELLATGNERILFVDDEKVLTDMGKQTLEHLGYEVVATLSSSEALKAFRAQPDQFDLVITDLTMPNMTGTMLQKELVAIRRDIPVILCTGFSHKVSKENAKAMGMAELVTKPFLKNELAKTIRRVLDERKSCG